MHTRLLETLVAAAVLDYGWGWSFRVPGAFIALGGIMVYLFLAAYPEDIGFPSPRDAAANTESQPADVEAQLSKATDAVSQQGSVSRRGVGLVEACLIPGVIPFALCLFFSKLVAYTFLYWLPFCLSQTGCK
uniref:Uncharacterized protein n=1 Tax=Kalanchoe fedtschenkoi TaxID=63787 RepID=A0A7N0VET9_KALFE